MGLNEFPGMPDWFFSRGCGQYAARKARAVPCTLLPRDRADPLAPPRDAALARVCTQNRRPQWLAKLKDALQGSGADEWALIGTSCELRFMLEQQHNALAIRYSRHPAHRGISW